MTNTKLFLLLTIIISFFGCGLERMASEYDKVIYEQTPKILEVHGGDVFVDLKGTFPEKYFAKKAIVEITPIIISETGEETKLKSVILQGEHATGGDETIFYESGGTFVYSDKIEYKENMKSSNLELRALATLEDDNKILGPVTVANGVVSTSMRVKNDEKIEIADHGYKEVETISETATIYFLVNKSNIRTTEKSDADVQKLKDFIRLGYKTESFVIKSSSSPEGTEKINTELSDDRQNSTLEYAKYLLKRLKADGAGNDDYYKKSSAGADWDGFNKLVSNSSINEKNTILSLNDRNKQKSQKERGELLKDMTQVYDALENDVLQYLRKSEITINSYLPKKTREEIVQLSTTNPSKLTIEELLYSASLEENAARSLEIYTTAKDLHNDWRAYNNIAAYHLSKGNLDRAYEYLNKAKENGGANESSVLTNLGIIASWNGELNKARNLFNKANTDPLNLAILDIRQGKYSSAADVLRGNSYNAALANILNGNNNYTCIENTAECFYLNAIAGARAGNETMLFTNLEKSIQKSETYIKEALNDLEFEKYRTHDKFIFLTK